MSRTNLLIMSIIPEKFCSSVLRWLSPPDFKSAFERAQDAREVGTAEWLFEEPIFKSWNQPMPVSESIQGNSGPSNGMLWINGLEIKEL